MSKRYRSIQGCPRVFFYILASIFFISLLLFSPHASYALEPITTPGQEGDVGGTVAPHLLEVLDQGGISPAGDASRHGPTVKIGGAEEGYRGTLQMGNSAMRELNDIERVITNNAIVINVPTYKPTYYFPGLVWTTTVQSNPQDDSTKKQSPPKLGIWGQMTDTGSKMYFGTSSNSGGDTSTTAGITNQALTIDQNGQVGVGIASPGAKLDVAGDIRASDGTRGAALVSDTAGGGRSYLLLDKNSANGIGVGSDYLYLAQESTRGVITSASGTPLILGSNTEQMRIAANGFVGIGTTNPSVKLQVEQNVVGTAKIAIFNPNANGVSALTLSASSTIEDRGGRLEFAANGNEMKLINDGDPGGIIAFHTRQGDVTSEKIRVNSNGYVGIGTTDPKADIDVGGIRQGGVLRNVFARMGEGNTTGAGTFLGVRAWATQQGTYGGKEFSIENGFYGSTNSAINFYRGGSTTGGFLRFATNNGTEQVTINASGSVGIGTLAPSAKLDIVSQSQDALRITGNEPGRVWRFGFGNDGNLITESAWDKWKIYLDDNNDSPDAFEIYHNGTASGSPTQVFGTYDDKVGIGTTSPQEKLQVQGGNIFGIGTNGGDERIKMRTNTAAGGYNYEWQLSSGQDKTFRLYRRPTNDDSSLVTAFAVDPNGNSAFAGSVGIAGSLLASNFGVPNEMTLGTRTKSREIYVNGPDDIVIPLGRFNVGTSIEVTMQAEGGWAERGAQYFINGYYNTLPRITFQTGNQPDRLIFYGKRINESSMYLWAKWTNASPAGPDNNGDGKGDSCTRDKGCGNAVRLTVTTSSAWNYDDKGDFSGSTRLAENVTAGYDWLTANGKIYSTPQGNNIEVGCREGNCWSNANGIIGFPGYGTRHGSIAFYPDSNALALIDSSSQSPADDYGALNFDRGFNDLWAGRGIFKDSVGVGTTSPGAKLHVAGGGAIVGTNGSTSNTRTLTLLADGQSQINHGPYPGAWTAALQIQNNDNSRLLWMSPLDAKSGANARIRSVATGLDVYTGGANTDNGVLALSMSSAGNVGIGTTDPGSRKLDVRGSTSVGTTASDYTPAAQNWNYTLLLNGQDTTSIGFHDSRQNVGSIRFKNNLFTIGGDDGWGVASTYFPANVILARDPSDARHAVPLGYMESYVTDRIDGLTWKAPVDGDPAAGPPAGYGECNFTMESWATFRKSNSAIYICNGFNWVLAGSTATVPYAKKNSAGKVQIGSTIDVNESGLINIPQSVATDAQPMFNTVYTNNWFRSNGKTGWLNETYGGGWFMVDDSWIRSYGNKNIYQNTGILRTDGTLQVGGDGGTLNVAKDGNFAYRTNVLFANTSGNVGIGTTSPSRKLDVQGGSIALAASEVIGSGKGFGCSGCGQAGTIELYNGSTGDMTLQSGTNYDLVLNPGGGSVGIGTASPQEKLHVAGTIRSDGGTGLSFQNINASGNGANNRAIVAQDYSQWIWNTATNWGLFWAGNDNPAYSAFGTSNPNEIVFVGAGNVRSSIDLDNGNAYFQGLVHAGGSQGDAFRIGDDAKLSDINIANTIGLYGVKNSAVGSLKLGSAGGTISGYNGNIGIGTTSPTLATLQVNGNIMSARASDGTNAGFYDWYNNSNNRRWHFTMRSGDDDKLQLYFNNGTATSPNNQWSGPFLNINPNGNVGIGQADPDAKLEINGNAVIHSRSASWAEGLRIVRDSEDAWAEIFFGDSDGDTTSSTSKYDKIRWGIGIGNTGDPGKKSRDLQFLAGNGGPSNLLSGYHSNAVFALDHDMGNALFGGNVGIGTTSPQDKLHVVASGGFPNNVPIVAQSNSTFFGARDAAGNERLAINLDWDGTSYPVNFYDKYDGSWHQDISLKNGNVGIGKISSNASYKLDVAGIINGDSGFISNNVHGTGTASYHPGGIYVAKTAAAWIYPPTIYLGDPNPATYNQTTVTLSGTFNVGQVNFKNNAGVTQAVFDKVTGYIGIGTTSPGNGWSRGGKLHINGGNVPNGSIDWNTWIGAAGVIQNPNGGGVGLKFQHGNDSSYDQGKWAGIAGIAESEWSNSVGLAFYTSGSNSVKMRISDIGNVGIGKAPSAGYDGYKLDVNGTINAKDIKINGSPLSTSQWTTAGNNIYFPAMQTVYSWGSAVNAGTSTSLSSLPRCDSTQPTAFAQCRDYTQGCGRGGLNTCYYVKNAVASSQQSPGNVGIGTSSPGSKLTVDGGSSFMWSGAYNVSVRNYFTDGEKKGRIRVGAAWGIPGFYSEDSQDIVLGVAGAQKAYIGSTGHFMTVQGNGQVGVNTTTAPCPGCMLDVQGGDINVGYLGETKKFADLPAKDKLAYATDRIGLDVAELFESEELVEIGDVLVVSDNERKLKKSNSQYDGKIVGVVSGSPALLFEGSELKLGSKPNRFEKGTKPPVALAGRIPVKVSLENGSIKPGDYLTSSSKPGVAMKATEPGMTIGVALEAYDGSGEGKILVFLNLGEKNIKETISALEDKIKASDDRYNELLIKLQKRIDAIEGKKKYYW